MGLFDNYYNTHFQTFVCKACGYITVYRKSLGNYPRSECVVCKKHDYMPTDIPYITYVDLLKSQSTKQWKCLVSRYFTDEQLKTMLDFRNTLPPESFHGIDYLPRGLKQQPPKEPEPTYTPTCPTCHSPDVAKIGSAKRAGSVLLFGVFSSKINKQFECKNCGYKW